MKEVTRYQCEFCKKLFMTPNRHYCKMNPELKNCFTCINRKGWFEEDSDSGYCTEMNVECTQENYWGLAELKQMDYNLQCEDYKEGSYLDEGEYINPNPF